MEDGRIVDLFIDRDQNAISQMAGQYGFRIRRLAYNILHDEETAKECENDTYLEMWNLIPPHEPREYLLAFASKIVRHIALNRCRELNSKKRAAIYCELTSEMEECIPAGNDPESEFEADQLGGIINGYLSDCSFDQRNVFVRRYWFFDSIADIAERYGYSESKVKTMLFRMREQLRERIIEGGYEV